MSKRSNDPKNITSKQPTPPQALAKAHLGRKAVQNGTPVKFTKGGKK